jgi:cytosine/uracil/thiamine/allantoin permease
MLYQNEGIYRYHGGVNWRAALTLLIVVPINLPGLIHAINPKIYIGNLLYFCKLSNFANTPPHKSDPPLSPQARPYPTPDAD